MDENFQTWAEIWHHSANKHLTHTFPQTETSSGLEGKLCSVIMGAGGFTNDLLTAFLMVLIKPQIFLLET